MPNWPALLLAPTIALANAAIAYALVTPSCARQDSAMLHVLSACSLLACAAMTLMAGRNWLGGHLPAGMPDAPTQARYRFLCQVATLCGLLSVLVVLAEWLPVWILSPCIA